MCSSDLHGIGRFFEGEVLILEKPIDDVQPGHYVFLGRQGVMMTLCEPGMEEDEGDITTTDKLHFVHWDFEEVFKILPGVWVEGVLWKK